MAATVLRRLAIASTDHILILGIDLCFRLRGLFSFRSLRAAALPLEVTLPVAWLPDACAVSGVASFMGKGCETETGG